MTTTLSTPLLAFIRKIDPDFIKERNRQLEYRFTRRLFFANPHYRGAYEDASIDTEFYQPITTEDGTGLITET